MRFDQNNTNRHVLVRADGLFYVAARAVVLACVVGLSCRTWIIEGILAPLKIPSGSMAPALLGPHCRFTCPACRQTFLCDAAVPSIGVWRVCPHCGKTVQNTPPLDVLEGDRARILKSVYLWRQPQRWEMAVFRNPDQPAQLAVKRIVGLPGETIRVRDGDVYVNDRIARKSLEEQIAMSILVYEDTGPISPRVLEPARWRADAADARWRRSDQGGFCRLDAARTNAEQTTKAIDWLVYHHRRRIDNRMADSPVTDEFSYNQWRTPDNDDIRPIRDFLLRFLVERVEGAGRLSLRIDDGNLPLEASIDPATGQCELQIDGRVASRAIGPSLKSDAPTPIVFSTIDRQAILAVGNQVVLRETLPPAPPKKKSSERPLAIGATGSLNPEIHQLRVYRDVYYARPPGIFARWGFEKEVRLGDKEYFVLGDNSVISEDSRSWSSGPALPENCLIGKPIALKSP